MSHHSRFRRVVLVVVLFVAIFRVPALAAEGALVSRPWLPRVVAVFSGLWNFFLPLGHEIDPNGAPVPGGGDAFAPPPGGSSDLGHELDPDG